MISTERLVILMAAVFPLCWMCRPSFAWSQSATSVSQVIPPDKITYAAPPEFAEDFGTYRSPLLNDDGSEIQTAEQWEKRRQEIRHRWMEEMGPWPDEIVTPDVQVLDKEVREDIQQWKIRFRWAPDQWTEGYLLIPPGEDPKPAVITVYYEPETAIGRGKPLRDYAWQLSRRGFVTLSLGTAEASQNQTFAIFHPDLDHATVQPLSMLAYAAVNGRHLLANRPEVDSQRIGIMGHSFGGKWAMFASCLSDHFCCAVWSDPGIVFDDRRPGVNYWEPWYLGYHARPWRKRGPITQENPAYGLYVELRKQGRDLHELHSLMAPRPFLVAGGEADPIDRWQALNHSLKINQLLGHQDRVAMTLRETHEPTQSSNQAIYHFLETVMKPGSTAVSPTLQPQSNELP